MVLTGSLTTQRMWHLPKKANSGSLLLQIWQLTMHTLNQRLGRIPIESKDKISPMCRQDYPIPIPINKGGFRAPRRKKFESKNCKKPAIPLFPNFLSPCQPSAALFFFSLTAALSAANRLSFSFFVTSSTTRHEDHQPTSIIPETITVSSLQNPSSFPPWSTPATVPPSDAAQTISSTSWSWPRILRQVSRSSVNLYLNVHVL